MMKKIVLALSALFLLTATPALADDDRRGGDRDRHWDGGRDRHWDRGDDRWRGRDYRHKDKHYKARGRGHHVKWHRGGRHWVPPGHRKGHHKVVVHKHYGHGHKHRRDYRRDDHWALYAVLALQIVDVLNESQRDNYAWAQQRAYNAPIGETITWNDSGAYGSVVPLREGNDTAGRYCREFQQEVYVGNRSQSGYGIACRQPDGAWQIVSN